MHGDSINSVAAFEAIVLPSVAPWLLLGLQTHLLDAAAPGSTPVLLVHAHPGRALSLGRYHPWRGPAERAGITAWRRLTGGRVLGSGEGWAGLFIIAPYPGALLAERDAAITAERVMNRYVRGLLSALKALGIDASYPGRDAITARGREIAACSFEVNAAGAILFEAFIAVNRGMEEVVHDLQRFDPDGELPSRIYGPDSASKLVRELDRDIGFDELAQAIVAGYASSFGEASRRSLSAVERAQAEYRGAALEAAGWLQSLVADPRCAASARIGAQLGTIEARLGLAGDGSIERFQLLGDFIANSPALGRLESELRGNSLDDPGTISRAIRKILDNRENFILGAGDPDNLAKLISRAR